IVLLKDTVPWLIALPLGIGAIVIVAYEWAASKRSELTGSDVLVTVPSDFVGLKSYDQLLALEVKPLKKEPKGQLRLPLFPGFQETTPANAIRTIIDEAGNKIEVVNCDRYSALLVTYLLEHLDSATDKSLAAGLHRFGALNKGDNAIQALLQDKGVREAIKSDFRGNLLALVSKGGEKVVKDLIKTIEARKAESEKPEVEK